MKVGITMKIKVIDDFDRDHWYLSNFTFSPFYKNGNRWDTVEHYFQAMKTIDLEEREKIRKCGHPRFAKKLGRTVKLRSDWEDIKEYVMYSSVLAKFTQNQEFKSKLLNTEGYYLIEGNTWHDNIWGDCKCNRCKNIKGHNLLGKILMKVRNELDEK